MIIYSFIRLLKFIRELLIGKEDKITSKADIEMCHRESRENSRGCFLNKFQFIVFFMRTKGALEDQIKNINSESDST